jgi:hypothetical protein
LGHDWQIVLFGDDGALIRVLEAWCARRFPRDPALADEAFNHSLAVLSASDYAKLRSFRGDSQPRTFVVSCFRNAVEDFARGKFGKCVPPAWIKELGRLYTTVYRRLCCEQRAIRTVIDDLHHTEGLDRAAVRDLAAVVQKGVPDCSLKATVGPRYEEFDTANEEVERKLQDGHEAEPETHDLVAAICLFIAPDTGELDPERARQLHDLRNQVLPTLDLSSEQKLLIRMVTLDGRTLTEAAPAVRMDYHAARRALKAGLAALERAFRDGGLSAEDFA